MPITTPTEDLTGWLTADEMSELTSVPAELLELGADAGLFNGLTKMRDGQRLYTHDVASVIAWSDRLGDDVTAGRMDQEQARVLLLASRAPDRAPPSPHAAPAARDRHRDEVAPH